VGVHTRVRERTCGCACKSDVRTEGRAACVLAACVPCACAVRARWLCVQVGVRVCSVDGRVCSYSRVRCVHVCGMLCGGRCTGGAGGVIGGAQWVQRLWHRFPRQQRAGPWGWQRFLALGGRRDPSAPGPDPAPGPANYRAQRNVTIFPPAGFTAAPCQNAFFCLFFFLFSPAGCAGEARLTRRVQGDPTPPKLHLPGVSRGVRSPGIILSPVLGWRQARCMAGRAWARGSPPAGERRGLLLGAGRLGSGRQ